MNAFLTAFNTFAYNFMFTWHEKYRVILGLGMIFIELMMYLSWFWIVYLTPSYHQFVNLDIIEGLLSLTFWFIVFPLVSAIFIISLNKNNKTALTIAQYFILIAYTTFIGYFAHFFIEKSILVGIAISCSPVLALLLFKREVAFFIFFYNLAVFSVVLYLITTGSMTDAPVIKNPNLHLNSFWIMTFFHFSFTKILLLFVAMDLLLSSLHKNDKEIQHLSNHDSLTHVLNRRAIMLKIKEYCATYIFDPEQNISRDASIIMVDIDDFKGINDNYGHLIGDKVLHAVAQTLDKSVRHTDFVGRYGGEEFVILLEDCLLDQALFLAENIRQKLYEINITDNNNTRVEVTASLGVSCTANMEKPFDIATDTQRKEFTNRFIDCADKALYLAKTAGRNKVYTLQQNNEQDNLDKFLNHL